MVAVIISMSILALIIQMSNQSRDVYTGTESTVPTQTERPHTKLKLYEENELGLRYGVPEDWTQVVKDGFKTYIHQPTATSLQVRIEDYIPELLIWNEDTAHAYAQRQGGDLTSFYWNDANSFSLIYNKYQDKQERTTAFLEMVQFDRLHCITMSVSVMAEYYDSMSDIIDDVMESFYWEKPAPWPDGTYVYYSEYGAFEFAYPASWNVGTTDNAYIAQDPETGGVMSIAVSESDATYQGVSQIQYVQFAGETRNNFALSTFAADDNIIYAVGTYYSGDQEVVLVQYLLASGRYEYAITFETPSYAYQQQATLFDGIIKTFRYYPEYYPELPPDPTEDIVETNTIYVTDTQESETPLSSEEDIIETATEGVAGADVKEETP